MEIIKIEFVLVKLQLSVPSVVAYGRSEVVENFVVKITAANGKTGWGNIAPEPYVTGENPELIKQLIESDEVQNLLKGKDVNYITELENLLLQQLTELPSVRAGISIALWDLRAKALGIPLIQLLGQARECIPTSITIPLLPLNQIKDLGRHYKDKGFRIPKIKLGGNIEEDFARICLIKEVFGKDVPLRLDANQSYDVRTAMQLLEQLHQKDINVEFLEQPTPAPHIYSLKQVTDLSPGIGIMADESVLNCKDVYNIASIGAAHYINLKLMKCGGIEATRQANYVSHCADMPAMMGCMDESVISISAALALCLSHPNFQFADLDGHIEIEQDIARGGVILKEGILYPDTSAPGLGIVPDI